MTIGEARRFDVAGTYVLVLRLDTSQTIVIGRLGAIEFPEGWYLYVGSAHGPGGLAARLARHRRRLGGSKRSHWHVDYLREHTTWHGAWVCVSEIRLECEWAAGLRSLPGAATVAPGFGASDCGCTAHLVHVLALPDDGWFANTFGAKRHFMRDEQLEGLLQTLTVGDEDAREAAALSLGRRGPVAIEPLTQMLASQEADVRWWAARALAEVGGEGVVGPLVGALSDPDPDVRACAALALGRMGEGAAAPALATSLFDKSAFVAGIAADALQMIGEPAVGALTEVLANENPHARLLAVRALSRIRSQRAIEPLFGALEDSSYLVRYYAQEALEALGVGMVFLQP
jgi:HEAT repeat protein/Uri superfamily endonuclease